MAVRRPFEKICQRALADFGSRARRLGLQRILRLASAMGGGRVHQLVQAGIRRNI